MGKLIYSMITSLDGYVADEAGQFDWAEPDEELHVFVDEVVQYLSPAIVGGGTRFLPDGLRLRLELHDERRFGNGVVYVRYTVRSDSDSG